MASRSCAATCIRLHPRRVCPSLCDDITCAAILAASRPAPARNERTSPSRQGHYLTKDMVQFSITMGARSVEIFLLRKR